LDGNSLADPPKSEEIEISLFGPGFGESIAVHVGLGSWIIVDSCLDRESEFPAALKYLQSIGVDFSSSVELVVATHWHDDHTRGLASVFEECTSAKFICSASLRSEEFLTLVCGLGKRALMTNPGVEEFYRIIQILKQRVESSRPESKGPEFAIADKLLWRRDGSLDVEIHALSPSSASMALSFSEIAQLLPTESQTKRRAVTLGPNRVAVALWIRVGDVSLLLGSDVEETGDPATGWSGILASNTRPSGKASVFKVAHHGSSSAHHPHVWSEMLVNEPFAVLTPFVRGKLGLPTRPDVRRILENTPNGYATAPLLTSLGRKRDRTVEKTIRETVRMIRVIAGPTGHVRLRKSLQQGGNNSWSVEMFNGALNLKRFYN